MFSKAVYTKLNGIYELKIKIEQDVTGILNDKCPDDFRNKIVGLFNEVQSLNY